MGYPGPGKSVLETAVYAAPVANDEGAQDGCVVAVQMGIKEGSNPPSDLLKPVPDRTPARTDFLNLVVIPDESGDIDAAAGQIALMVKAARGAEVARRTQPHRQADDIAILPGARREPDAYQHPSNGWPSLALNVVLHHCEIEAGPMGQAFRLPIQPTLKHGFFVAG